MDAFRRTHPKSIGKSPVYVIEDYKIRTRRLVSGAEGPLTLPEADVIKLLLDDGSWICIRPSGTESKCKLYFGVRKNNKEEAETVLGVIEHDVIEMVNIIP